MTKKLEQAMITIEEHLTKKQQRDILNNFTSLFREGEINLGYGRTPEQIGLAPHEDVAVLYGDRYDEWLRANPDIFFRDWKMDTEEEVRIWMGESGAFRQGQFNNVIRLLRGEKLEKRGRPRKIRIAPPTQADMSALEGMGWQPKKKK